MVDQILGDCAVLTKCRYLVASLILFLNLFFGQFAGAKEATDPDLHEPISAGVSTASITPEAVRKDRWIAYRLAKDPWLDKIAAADPRIVAAICAHSGPAKILAKHRHLDKIAESDHYLCRRLTQWEGATQKLCRSPYFDKVIALDPQGMYFALNRKPEYARVLARQTMFNELANSDRYMPQKFQMHMK